MAKDAKFKISAEDKTKDALKSASSGLSRLAKSATLAGVAAGAAAVGGLALLVKATLPAIDNLGKTADSLGLTTEALISLRQGAQLSGVSVEVLDKALLRFNRAAGDAQIGRASCRERV